MDRTVVVVLAADRVAGDSTESVLLVQRWDGTWIKCP